MTTEEYLIKLGLSKKQTILYLDLAANPESTVVQVHRRVRAPRSSIYLELERLTDQGLVISKKVGKSTYYRITNPTILRLNLEEESEKLALLMQNLPRFDHEIKEMVDKKSPPQTINIYRGQQGIKQMLWNIILSRTPLLLGYSPGQLEYVTDRKFAEKWREEFMRRNMFNKIIFNQPKPLKWSDIPHFLERHVEAKTLDEKKIKFDRMTFMYDDTLMVCNLKTDVEQYGVEIHDKLLFNSYKQIFEFLWDHVAEKLI